MKKSSKNYLKGMKQKKNHIRNTLTTNWIV